MSLRDVLARPTAYDAFGAAVGVARVRAVFGAEYIRSRPGQRLLDIGCGPGSMVPYLPGVVYAGFDVNAAYIAAARARHPDARFLCASIAEEPFGNETFDVVIAAGVIHHLDDDEVGALLRLAGARLRPGGRLFTLDPCFADGQHPIARWLVANDRGRHLRGRDEHVGLLRRGFPSVTAVIRHDLLRVPYTHLIAECARD